MFLIPTKIVLKVMWSVKTPNFVEENAGKELIACSGLWALGSASVDVVRVNISLNMDEGVHQLS